MLNQNKHSSKYKLLCVLAVVVAAGVILAILEVSNTTHIFHKSPRVSGPTAPITSLPSKGSVNNGEKKLSTSSSANQQTSDDKHGEAPSGGIPTDPSMWLTSQSGLITVKLPSFKGTLKNGGELYGSSKEKQVEYRLIDDQVGVISQGNIDVVNGNFTAAIKFKPSATSGRLDVFTTDPTGKESNEVQVQVSF